MPWLSSSRVAALVGGLLLSMPPSLTAEEGAEDPYAKEGNVPPVMAPLATEREEAILKDVKVPDGFAVTVFAAPPAVNYPVFVAAAPDGTVYVSSDGNGSLGRDPGRGRVIRLRDLDGDGKADETKVFCEVDAPRGLVWDDDRLYLVHPPHLSVFVDEDRDGVAESQQVLVSGIAFGYQDRPADHTTNGLTLGVDGWLYVAGGDFGFMEAVGTDGRKVQHRGGGVIRVRPDGTGLEVFSTGTRNVLEMAVSPRMDLFARDNTNDGGGWNVRFHHLTPLADHGYPRLYKNFADECIAPLADYGGGSGCGAVYIDEPGFGEWNDAPFTADWGTGALYHHAVKPRRETFEEIRKPEAFIRMTRPTDADVDAMSRVYAASWKGATFRWEGADVGYIVCVRPEGFTPEPLPDYKHEATADLIRQLWFGHNPSHRRRLEAIRELERRGVAAYQDYYAPQFLLARTTERNELDRIAGLDASFGSGNQEAQLAAVSHKSGVLQHTAIQALARGGAVAEIFESIDRDPATSEGLLRALAKMHRPDVVQGVLERFAQAKAPAERRRWFACLCRLHFQEGEWKGNSWGTRPDTRGPYYQPEPWSETSKIAATLQEALQAADAQQASYYVKEMARNRIQSDSALQRVLELAETHDEILPQALSQLAQADTIPQKGVDLLLRTASQEGIAVTPEMRQQVIAALSKTEGEASCLAMLQTLVLLQGEIEVREGELAQGEAMEDAVKAKHQVKIARTRLGEAQRALRSGVKAFTESPKLENHHLLLEALAEKVGEPTAVWADAALIKLSGREKGSPESKALSAEALEKGWEDEARRGQIIRAALQVRDRLLAEKILAALEDPDEGVRALAEEAVKSLRLEPRNRDRSPKIAGMSVDDAVKAIKDRRGEVALGEQIFARATCNACHTVNMDEAQKGPYLGNITQTYPRLELARNILEPNKTIAQGFASELFTLADGSQQMGFVTLEGAEEVTFRNIAAQEFTVKQTEIQGRQKLPQSLMPPGLMAPFSVHEFASLLDFLESLAEENEEE